MKILQTSNTIWRVISPLDRKVWRYQSGNQKPLIEKKTATEKWKKEQWSAKTA
jgi:hypothetical protein